MSEKEAVSSQSSVLSQELGRITAKPDSGGALITSAGAGTSLAVKIDRAAAEELGLCLWAWSRPDYRPAPTDAAAAAMAVEASRG